MLFVGKEYKIIFYFEMRGMELKDRGAYPVQSYICVIVRGDITV